jgi:hypothetical protein
VLSNPRKYQGFVAQEAFDLPAILENRFGQYYAPGGTKDLSSAAVVKGQTGHQRRNTPGKPAASKTKAKPGRKK